MDILPPTHKKTNNSAAARPRETILYTPAKPDVTGTTPPKPSDVKIANSPHTGVGSPQRRRAIPKSVRAETWIRNCGEVFKDLCHCCFQTSITVFNFHVAHIISVAMGGSDHLDNLLPTCAACNLSMGTRSLHEFMLTYGYIKPQSTCVVQ